MIATAPNPNRFRNNGLIWILIGIIGLILFSQVVIHMTTDSTDEETSDQAGSSGQTTAEMAEKEALAKVERFRQKMQELAEAETEEDRNRIHRELVQELGDLTGEGMQEAMRENPAEIGLAVQNALRELIQQQQAAADIARANGDEVRERIYVDNAIAIGVAARALRESMDSAAHDTQIRINTNEAETITQEIETIANTLRDRFWNLGD